MNVDLVERRWRQFCDTECRTPTHVVISMRSLSQLMEEEISYGRYLSVGSGEWKLFGMKVVLAPVDDEIFLA